MVDAVEHEPALLVESLPGLVDEIAPLGRELSLAADDTVWNAGGAANEVLFVLDGHLQVLSVAPAGGEAAVLRHLFPGALALEPQSESRATVVRARTASRVLLLGLERFRDLLRRRGDLLERLFWLQLEHSRQPPQAVVGKRVLIDPATGLYHEGFFRERLEIELERAGIAGDSLIVALFDADRLGAYEKAHGREAAEQALARMADLLRKTGRRGDVAARFGEDELGTLLYGASASDGWRFAEAYRGAILATASFSAPDERPRHLTISGGIAAFPQDGRDAAALLAAARERLRQAKQSGRNCVVGAGARSG